MLVMSGLVIFIFFLGSRTANAQSNLADKPHVMEDNVKVTALSTTVKDTTPATTMPSVLPEGLSKGKRTKTMIKIIFQVGLERKKIEMPTVASTGTKTVVKEM